MQVEVEDVGPCKKLLKIEVPPERVGEELSKAYEQLNDSMAVPGFRKGHVPRWLMESKFGKQVNEDARDALVAESFDKAVKEQELHPIGEPKFDEDIKLSPGEPLSFAVTLEVQPEFEIDDYTKLTLKKSSVSSTKAEIKERVDAIRKRYAKLEEVTEGSPKREDVVMCHVTLRGGDEVHRDVPRHQFIVGDHVLVGMTLDETVDFVTGAKVGEAVEKTVKLPDDYSDEAKRGAEMTLALRLEGIRRPVLPEVSAEWVKEIGFDSLDEFNDEVRSAVEREKDRAAEDQLQEQMTEQLLTKADFDLPEDVVNSMAEKAAVRRSLYLRYQGVPAEEVEKQLDKLRAESRESAGKAAKLFFILNKIADKERIFVTEDEIQARIEVMAPNYDRSPEQVRRELETKNRLAELRTSMREEKVKAFLLEKAVIKGAKGSSKKGDKSEK